MLRSIHPMEDRAQMSGGDSQPQGPNERAEAVLDALAGLPGVDATEAPDTAGRRWLRAGIALGLEHPDRGRALIALLDPAGDDEPAPSTDRPAGAADRSPEAIPIQSSLLARASALPAEERAAAGPEVAFGWVARLAPDQILQLGRVVGEMLEAGAPPDLARGFGLTWSAGVRVARDDLEAMLQEFTELEIVVGSTLTGRDLGRIAPPPRPTGIAAWLGDWIPRSRPGESQAAAAIEQAGDPGRRGLVALWNLWMAMRYRTRLSAQTFAMLAQPWLTVVGPLPE
jgi:hypothetical protein